MKTTKRFLSVFLAVAMMLTLAPAAFAADTSGLQGLIDNAAAGSTIELTSDYTLTDALTINKPITIDGKEHVITAASGKHAVNVSSGGVSLKNLTINASGSGYGINATGANLTVTNCKINAGTRGVNFYPVDGVGAILSITDTVINNPLAETPYGVYYNTDNRGVATGNVRGGTVEINNSDICGFKYGINAVVDPVGYLRNGEGTVFNVNDTNVVGWTALNMWSANSTYNFKNCNLIGVNKFSGGSNDYAIIMANDGICGGDSQYASTVNIIGGELTPVRYGESLQAAVYVDYQCYTKVNFLKNKLTKVKVNCYGTQEYPAAVFMFQGIVGAEKRSEYIADSKYDLNVTATNYILDVGSVQTFDLMDEALEFVHAGSTHIGGARG